MQCPVALVMVLAALLGGVHARYAPARDHTPDWVNLISGKQQFKDARILYSLLNSDQQNYSVEKRDMIGFDSSEGFEGFQHPFYYHQRQQQNVNRDPVVFSRLSALAPSTGARRNHLLQGLPVRRSLRDTPDSPQAPSRKDDMVA